jgi:valyl-tRNA synthetase
MVNWCPRCLTAISDIEVEHREKKGSLWDIKYPLIDKKTGRPDSAEYITVSTTRPETMLGDTAVAVNPKDRRYKRFIGQRVLLPLIEREIPVIADSFVDEEFGTGAVKVTPAHDLNDFEMGKRHNLEKINIMTDDAIMNESAGRYCGMERYKARKKVIEDLEKLGYIAATREHSSSIGTCSRCDTIVEPRISNQWFVSMSRLAAPAIDAVMEGRVKFIPKKWEKIYFNWMENIRDWCISRQLWWGHKIPLENETDVLDTWFSSALWPFATLGWPKKTNDLKNFYPTNNLFTARDIINLWVARMIFSGKEFMGKNPFEKVFIHPTVLTKDGKRMSKSLGTGINPIGLCEKYGTDAVRFGLFWQVTGGQDMRFTEDNIAMGKKFCNKLWNASRFVLMQVPDEIQIPKKPRFSKITGSDKKILKTLEKAVKATGTNLDKLEFGKTAQALYDFFWHDFCDVYIEKTKQESKEETKQVLFYVLFASLKLLHPFIPFVTEEIYQQLPLKNKKECLMIEDWPK